jgi:hypothetical protein
MNMNRKSKTWIVIGCLLMLSAAAGAQHEPRSMAIVLEQPQQHIPDFTLVDRLNSAMAMYAKARVVVPAEDTALPVAPGHRFDLEKLVNWGREIGIRYLIYLQVDYRRIVTVKRWSIPLILSHYVVEGHLDGAYSLIDVRYGKLIDTWNLETTLEAGRQLQVFEDYRDDPDLHIAAPQKVAFLKKLEDRAAAQIVENLVPNMRGR